MKYSLISEHSQNHTFLTEELETEHIALKSLDAEDGGFVAS